MITMILLPSIGDRGGENDQLVCTGYHVTARDATGSHYIEHCVWWSEEDNCWQMESPTIPGRIMDVPKELEIEPTFGYPDE